MKRTLVIALLAAAAVAVAGVAYAAIPSANGTISACKDSKGALKVIDVDAGQKCANGQQLLNWNQQGPQGPPGPSDAYFTAAPDKSIVGGAGFQTVAELSLPAGSYVISAKADPYNSLGGMTGCGLWVGNQLLESMVKQFSASDYRGTMPMMDAIVLNQPTAAKLLCYSTTSAVVQSGRISAIKVGTLTTP
jgi:hypothetical protein